MKTHLASLLFACSYPILAAAALDSEPLAAARTLYEQGHDAAAQAAFERLAAAEPGNAEAACFLGRLALRRGDATTAVHWLEQATTLDATRSDYFGALGDAYGNATRHAGPLAKLGLTKKCLAAWEKALALDPDNLQVRRSRLEFYRQAPAFIGGGRDKAYAEAERIRQRDEVMGADVLSLLYVDEKRFPEAFAIVDAATARNPAASQRLGVSLGRVALASGERLAAGETAVEAYLREDPRPGDPKPATAQVLLGRLREKRGDVAAARASYAAALKLNPDSNEAKQALARIDRPASSGPNR